MGPTSASHYWENQSCHSPKPGNGSFLKENKMCFVAKCTSVSFLSVKMWFCIIMCFLGIPAMFPQNQGEAGADSFRKTVWLQRDVHLWKVWHIPAKTEQDPRNVRHHFHLLRSKGLEDRRAGDDGHQVSSEYTVISDCCQILLIRHVQGGIALTD